MVGVVVLISRDLVADRGGDTGVGIPTSAGSGCYFPSHAFTCFGCDLTHFSAAFSGSTWSPAIHLATRSWSVFVHVHRFANATAGDPLVANFLLITFSMMVTPYAHLYCLMSPPDAESSWQPLKRGGSLTSASLYVAFRYCGVYQ